MEGTPKEIIEKTVKMRERLEDYYARGMITEGEEFMKKTILYAELKDFMDAWERKNPGQGKQYAWTELLEFCGLKKEDLQ